MTVVYQTVDVQDGCAGQLNADFDDALWIPVARFHSLFPSGIISISFQVLSLCTVFFLVSSFSFTAFCLSVCFKIFNFFFYFQEIKGMGSCTGVWMAR